MTLPRAAARYLPERAPRLECQDLNARLERHEEAGSALILLRRLCAIVLVKGG